MTQLDLFPTSAYLTRVDATVNMDRYYSLNILPDLFGGCALVRCWGRVGRSSTTRIELHRDAVAADAALRNWQRSKVARGYKLV